MSPSFKPAVYLAWLHGWIILFFLFDLVRTLIILFSGQDRRHLGGFTHTALPFAVFLVTTPLLYVLERKFHFWQRIGPFRKYGVLVGTYCLCMIASLLLLLAASEIRGSSDYFGGDAGGSPALLLLPSGVFYLVTGLVVAAVLRLRQDKK